MDVFCPLDYILLMSGCKVFVKKRVIRILNVALLAILLVAYAAYGIIHVMYPKSDLKRMSLPNLLPYIEFLYSLLFVYVMITKRSQIEHQITSTLAVLNVKQRKILRQHAIYSALAVLLLFLIGGGSLIYRLLTNKAIATGQNFDPVRFWKGPIFYYTSTNNWFLTGIVIYVFFVKMLRYMEENYYVELEAKVDSQKSYQLILERRQLTMLGEELIGTFSFLPVLFFSYLFIASSSVLMEIIDRDETPIKHFLRAWPLLWKLASIFYLVSACDTCTQATQSNTDRVVMKLMSGESVTDREFLVRELERSAERNFTAWKMFSIDRNLVLVFSSSLISFTVLVIQLTEGAKEG